MLQMTVPVCFPSSFPDSFREQSETQAKKNVFWIKVYVSIANGGEQRKKHRNSSFTFSLHVNKFNNVHDFAAQLANNSSNL